MHLLSSTAVFSVQSPFEHTTLFISDLNATAFYKDNPAGRIVYDDEIEVPPGLSETEHLPVEWDLGSVGYEGLRKALGGQLKLSAYAELGVRIGLYRADLWFKGRGIGAKIRI